MRIRIVHIISSLKVGGAEIMLKELIAHLDSSLFEHAVIYFHDGPIRSDIEKLGISTYYIAGLVKRYDPIFCRRLYSCVKRLQPTVIHASLWAATFLGTFCARLLAVPIVCSLHALCEHEGRLRTWLQSYSLPKAQRLVAVSPSVGLSVSEHIPIKAAQLTIITNAVHSHKLIKRAQEYNTSSPCKPGSFVIGSVGRLVKVKNYALLLEVVAKLVSLYATIELILVGDGPEYAALSQQAQQLGIASHVHLVGYKPAVAYYPLFSCFVQPSHYEGLSVALLEALCFALPCIVTGKQGSHDIITHNYDGLILEPDNKQALHDALITLYTNNLLRSQLGKAGAQTVKASHDFSTMIRKYTTLFTTVAQV